MPRRAFRLVAVVVLGMLLSACSRAPGEPAMSQAIGDFVVAAEDYPPAFVQPGNFTFRNLQSVPESDPAQFAVETSFDIAYTADSKTIVAALRAQSKAGREQDRRRANNFAERIKGVLTGAIADAEYELRFVDVEIGDRDHYAGQFVLARNEDGSWRVVEDDYR